MVNLFLPNNPATSSVITIALTQDKAKFKIGNRCLEVSLKKLLKCVENDNHFNATFDTQNSKKKIRKPNLRKICSTISSKLGFNTAIRGTDFIIEAIIYLYENNIDRFEMKIIYEMLIKKYSTSISNVKSSITNAANYMSDNLDYELANKIFSEYDGRKHPKPKYIIAHGVYELRKKYTPKDYDEERIRKILYSV